MPAGRKWALGRARVTSVVLSILASQVVSAVPAQASSVDLTIASTTAAAFVTPGSSVTVTTEVRNRSSQVANAGNLTNAVSELPLNNPGAIESWMTGASIPSRVVARSNTLPVPAGGSSTSSSVLPADAFAGAGVWGIETFFTVGGFRAATRTVVSLSAPSVPPVEVAAIVPVAARTPATGQLTPEELTALFGPRGSLRATIEAINGLPVTLGIDPRIVSSIRAAGSAAPSEATNWLSQLRTGGTDWFALQYGDADPALEAQLGLATLLTAAMPASADEDPSELSAPRPNRNLLWPSPGSVSEADLAVFDASGVQHLLLSSTNVTDAMHSHTSLRGRSVLVSQAPPSAALTRALEAESSIDWQGASNVLLAELSFFSGQRIVLTANRPTITESQFARATLELLGNSGVSRNVALSSLTAAGETELLPGSVNIDRLNRAAVMLAGMGAVERFASVAVQPAGVTGPLRNALMAAFSVGWESDPTGFRAIADEFDNRIAATLNGVRVVTSSTINVLASEAELPFTLENSLSVPVRIQVHVAPSNGRIVVGDFTETEIAANSRVTVSVPVKARIGNGTVDLSVTIRDSTGTPVAAPTIVPANVQADWEGFGALTIALLAAFLFGTGLVRQVLRARRMRHGAGDE